jgi:hypothetical protein
MSDISDIGEIGQIAIISNLESSLIVEYDLIESRNHLSISRSKDSSRPQSTCQEIISIGSQNEFLASDLGSVVGVKSGFGVFDTFIRTNDLLFSVVDDTSGTGVDEFADTGCFLASSDNVLGSGNIDQLVNLLSESVGGGSGVDHSSSARLSSAPRDHSG